MPTTAGLMLLSRYYLSNKTSTHHNLSLGVDPWDQLRGRGPSDKKVKLCLQIPGGINLVIYMYMLCVIITGNLAQFGIYLCFI